MKIYKQYKITFTNYSGKKYNLGKRLTKRANTLIMDSTFSHIFNTKKGALNNLEIAKCFNVFDVTLETIIKDRK